RRSGHRSAYLSSHRSKAARRPLSPGRSCPHRLVVFSLFFGRLAEMPAGGVPYPLFVFAGLLPWYFFSNAITSAGGSVVGSQNLVTKVYFPRLIIPLGSIGPSLVDFAIGFGMLLAMMLFYGV